MNWTAARPTGAGANSWTPTSIDKLPGTLASFGGRLTNSFIQGNADSFGFINLDPATREGACFALSVMWLIARKNGTDFFAKTNAPSFIALMNRRQVGMSQYKAAGGSSKTYLDDWLGPEGFTLRDHTEVDYPGAAKPITDSQGAKPINLQFGSGGHMVAADVALNGATFFDPNFGEAVFPTGTALRSWFEDRFLPVYHKTFNISWYRVSTYRTAPTIGLR